MELSLQQSKDRGDDDGETSGNELQKLSLRQTEALGFVMDSHHNILDR
jgi:hypothetical protein